MHGVTTAIVAFIFVCIVYPSLVKNRPQFYMALAAVLLIIALDALAVVVDTGYTLPGGPTVIVATHGSFWKFAYALTGLLQIGAVSLLVLSCGGLSVAELAGEMGNAIEVMRRGDTTKTVIVPLTGEKPKPRRQEIHEEDEEDDLLNLTTPPPPPPRKKPDSDSSLPLE